MSNNERAESAQTESTPTPMGETPINVAIASSAPSPAPVSPAAPPESDILEWLATRCQENLAGDENAKKYLRENGVADEAVWNAFRVGVADEKLIAELTAKQREILTAMGLLRDRGTSLLNANGAIVPTFYPCEPHKPVGLLKVSYSQNQHRFVTPVAGVACAADIGTHETVIIADAPLLALRLAQLGAKGVCIAETPEVLPSLRDWLSSRKVVLVSAKKTALSVMAAVLEPVKPAAQLVVSGTLERNTEALKALGLEVEKPTLEPLPVTQRHVVELHRYAQARLAAGQGTEILKEYGVEDAEFVSAYEVGYLPTDFRGALDAKSRRVWGNRVIDANKLVLPALDTSGVPVDLVSVGTLANADNKESVLSRPQGLVGAKVAAANENIVIADSFRQLAKLFSEGARNVVMLRNAEDARRNAARLKGIGVIAAQVVCRRESDEIAAALEGAGIKTQAEPFSKVSATPSVEPSLAPKNEAAMPPVPALPTPEPNSPPAESTATASTEAASKPVLAHHDPKSEQATFKSGGAAYTVDVPADGSQRLAVRLEHDGQVSIDRFDLASAAQRHRFATSAALKVKIPFEQIEADLLAMLDEIRRLQDEALNPVLKPKATAVQMTEAERQEALAVLKKPDLLDSIAADLDALGWAGEDDSKRLLYLIGTSRKSPTPLSAALLASSGAGKSTGIETTAELTPPEDLVHVSRLTDSALYYQDKDALRNKLLVIDEADSLTPEVLTALRVLQTRGSLTQSYVQHDPSGQSVTQFCEARGPVAVLTSTAGDLNEQNLSRCFEVAVDESPEQTARVLEAQRRLRADPENLGADGKRAKIVKRHWNMQRLLAIKPVIIPFADRIEFPAGSVKHRREQERFLNLIEASALLHQHQRLKQKTGGGEEFIVADVRDFEIAAALAADSIAHAGVELAAHARDVLQLAVGSKLSSFTMEDLTKLRPDWTRHKLRAGLDELLSLEAVTSPRGGRGRVREYQLQAGAAAMLCRHSVRLLPVAQLAKLAMVGEVGFANFTPTAAIG